MKICRFDDDRLGLVEGASVWDVTEALSVVPAQRYPFPRGDQLIAQLPAIMRRIQELRPKARREDLAKVSLLSPVGNPGKIVAAPVNYVKHLEEARSDAAIHSGNKIDEIQRIGLFLKATSALVGPADGVKLRHLERRNDHEIELVAVIGKAGNEISEERALQHVAGYCIGLDMTVRGPEERSLRKSIDTYAVLGPWLVTADEFGDPQGVMLELQVNGEARQRANTQDLVMSVPKLIAFASRFYTLYPGDLLYTGTPAGVGPVQPGDRMSCTIERIGTMTVSVRDAHDRGAV